MKLQKDKQNAFTVLGLLFAIAIWIVGFLAISDLLRVSLTSARSARRHLVGSHLAQEGEEIIHNMRDEQFLASSSPWHVVSQSHACFDSQGCEVDFENGGTIYDKPGEPYLKYSTTTHSYAYYVAAPDIKTTDYKRSIYLTRGDNLPAASPCQEITTPADCLRVVSEVKWDQGGKEKSLDIESYLFRWD